MPDQRSVFYGFGAWVGQQTGVTTCGWWPNDPADPSINWDPAKLIQSDLSKNPYAVRTGHIPPGAIQVDDKPSDGGMTKIGPTWPIGSLINSCWLESSVWAALPPGKKPPRPPPFVQCRDYELTTVLYWTGPLAPRRFWGFYAEISSTQGSLALCTIWPAGSSLAPGQPPAGSWWIDLATQAHPIEPGFTEVGVAPSDPKQGAVFLDAVTTSNLQLRSGKLPTYSGYGLYPTPT